jgi:Fe2+ or Zn2+ uptake regulation protein
MGIIVENIGEYLKSNGIKPSLQRMKIFEYLVGTKEHPTVDMIYKKLVKEMPTLSKTTVYNTLNLFVKNDIAHIITIEENETRYDADVSVHGHFKCTECEKVYDFLIENEDIHITDLKNFQINQKHVYFRGICEICLKNPK